MLVLPAELTHKQAAACLRMLSQATHTAHEEPVIADVSALVRFDSSALAVLLQCRRACLRQGERFAVHGMPPWRGLIAAARRTRRQRLMAAGAQTGSAPVRKPAFAAARALKVMAFIRYFFDSSQARQTVR